MIKVSPGISSRGTDIPESLQAELPSVFLWTAVLKNVEKQKVRDWFFFFFFGQGPEMWIFCLSEKKHYIFIMKN